MRGVLASLRVRLVLLVLIAALPAFGLIVWTSLEERQNERDHARDQAVQLTSAMAAQQGQIIENARQLLVSLSTTPQVLGGDPAACTSYLLGLRAVEQRYTAFAVSDLNGNVSCTTIVSDQPISISDRDYFKEILNTHQFTVSDYLLAKVLNTPTLGMAYPITDSAGTMTGVAVAGVDLAWFGQFTSQLTLPKDTTLTVIDRNGVVLARQPDPAQWVGTSIADLPVGKAVLSQGTGSEELDGLDGKPRLFAFAPFTETGRNDAYVAVGISTASAYAGINHTLYRNLSLLGVATLLALAAAWFLGDRLVLSGLRSLTRSADRLRAGDLSARTALHGGTTEVTSLAHSFDAMAQTLENRETERNRAEEALRESEERFRLLVEGVSDYAIVMLDPSGHVMSWNAGAERLKGYRADEIIGQHFSRFYVAGDAQRGTPEHELRVAAAEGRFEDEGWRVRKDGSRFWANVIITPVRDAAGQLRGFSKVTRDITERKRTDEELAQRAAELTRSNGELEQFAYVASHDLQEPLRMVGNYTQLLARRYKGRLDSDADDFINYAVEGARRMQDLINELLAFSRVGTRGKSLALTSADDILQQSLVNLTASIEETHAVVTHDPLPDVMADAIQLGQVFQNLIGNGLKFHQDATPPQIHVSAEQRDGEYVFSVHDNGIGISPEYHERIFVIFQRLHGREQYRGTGMGLAICKKIVERHGGRIWIESEAGKGATFCFTLPVVAAAKIAA